MTNLFQNHPNINNLTHFEKDELVKFIFKKDLFSIKNSDLDRFHHKLIIIEEELSKGKPFAYIVGKVKYQEIELLTPDGKVLIPRPETEVFCEFITRNILEKSNSKGPNHLHILEVGTGTGFISIFLKKSTHQYITAIEISKDAYDVARKNTELNKVEIELINASVKDFKTKQKFDFIVSNPPYIPITYKRNIAKSVKDFEPEIALFANNMGLQIYFEIINFAKTHLSNNGIICFEIFSKNQANSIIKYAKESKIFPNKINYEIKKDMFGKYRYLLLK